MPEKLIVDTGSESYPIHIGSGLLARAGEFVPGGVTGRPLYILCDQSIRDTHARALAEGLKASGGAEPKIMAIPGGEKAKSFDVLESVCAWMLEGGVTRKSILFAAGGGVIGDLAGFAAAIVMRGIDFVQVPTTLLAQVDSSVGGKTGINMKQGKNLVGSFNQPVSVICDMAVLKTLPPREFLAGYAEIVKYALINDLGFFRWLQENGKKICVGDDAAIAHAVSISCGKKAEIVGQDEFEEKDLRALLNLGHTFGHALEAAAGYDGRLLHGEAVSIGMVMAFRLSAKMGLCPPGDAEMVEAHLKSVGLKTRLNEIVPALRHNAGEIAAFMKTDKKIEGGKNTFILARGIGQAFVCRDVNMDDVVNVILQG